MGFFLNLMHIDRNMIQSMGCQRPGGSRRANESNSDSTSSTETVYLQNAQQLAMAWKCGCGLVRKEVDHEADDESDATVGKESGVDVLPAERAKRAGNADEV